MSKKRSGIEDLASTLIKQHGREEAFWLAVYTRNELRQKYGPDNIRYQIWKRLVYFLGYEYHE